MTVNKKIVILAIAFMAAKLVFAAILLKNVPAPVPSENYEIPHENNKESTL